MAAFATCRHCPWTGESDTYEGVLDLLGAHSCVYVVEGIEHDETGYYSHGCRCPVCRTAHSVANLRRKQDGAVHARQGEGHHWSKLTEADVREIKSLLRTGTPHVALARTFRVSRTNISQIARGLTWKHVA